MGFFNNIWLEHNVAILTVALSEGNYTLSLVDGPELFHITTSELRAELAELVEEDKNNPSFWIFLISLQLNEKKIGGLQLTEELHFLWHCHTAWLVNEHANKHQLFHEMWKYFHDI